MPDLRRQRRPEARTQVEPLYAIKEPAYPGRA